MEMYVFIKGASLMLIGVAGTWKAFTINEVAPWRALGLLMCSFIVIPIGFAVCVAAARL